MKVEEVARDIAQRPQEYAHKLKDLLGRVEEFNEVELRDFVISEELIQEETVNVRKVVGTAHPDYQGLYWSEMLLRGKRMHLNLPLLEKNPQYYLDFEVKLPVMEYVEVDGKVCVYGDGNHRTAIGKVFFELIGRREFGRVQLRRWVIDERAMELSQLAREKGVYFHVRKEKLSREDSTGRHRESFEVYFTTPKGRLTVNEFERYLKERKGLFSKVFAFLGGER